MQLDVLEVLNKARAILATNYCKWVTDDGRGHHCASGAISVAASGRAAAAEMNSIRETIRASAIRLHPELAGACRPRLNMRGTDFVDMGFHDRFELDPMIFVNNQLGQQAILEVFDDAIQNLELSKLCAEVESTHPDLDVKPEPVLVTRKEI